MIVKLAIVAAVLVGAILVFAATKPGTIRIQRSISIKAQPEKVFAFVNDFHEWHDWAPQDRSDPTMQRSFSGPERGKGAKSEWRSRGSAGKGRMEIVDLSPRDIKIRVDFEKPFKAHNINEFTIEMRGDTTFVVWTMQGTNPYLAKVMSVFVDMDRMMGKHFEKGLADLKTAAEK